MRVVLVQDFEGRIVGTAPSGVEEVKTSLPGTPVSEREAQEEALQVEVVPEPLEGQSIHEVDLPPELEKLEGAELLEGLQAYRVAVGEAKLVQRSM